VRSFDEECDDDNRESGDGCNAQCETEMIDGACGDFARSGGEECDDGNLDPGDGCNASCHEERCGNGAIDAGEECDPPAAGSCTDSCVVETVNCGDGEVQPSDGEECDDENDVQGDGCHDCREECGDERIDAAIGEECEPTYSDRCSDACRWLPACGDGEVNAIANEECDPSDGVTCVACRRVDPPPASCEGGAGGQLGSGGEGGGCSEDPVCVPSGVPDLVRNGTFDTNTDEWAAHSSIISLALVDDGDPEPQALQVTAELGSIRALSGAIQCIPVQAGREYPLEARYFIPASAPAGVGASVTALLYQGTSCTGAFLRPPGGGPEGRVRGAWTPYQYTIDTSALSGEGRLLLRLNVSRPANVEGSRVIWDSVTLRQPGAACGDCTLNTGETCDDGNQSSGDGCSAGCTLEVCGDGTQAAAEACDDGNQVFDLPGDTCTPSCRIPSECETCADASCGTALDQCLALEGEAEEGRRQGTARSVLCDELRNCVHETACNVVPRSTTGQSGAFLENCYCGTAGTACFEERGAANGSCRKQVEAALESNEPSTIAARFSGADADYPIAATVGALLNCEQSACGATCGHTPECGDGYIQDRNLEYTFVVDRQEVPCSDDLTYTGRGCSFEECDDGNIATGDGCDESCFLEACGNHVRQEGEDCDDGNRESGDGCSSECVAEYECGNGTVEEPFEECDPTGGEKVCTEAEFDDDPTQCGCDAQCTRIVCGNGVVQRPAEECDPLHDLSCGEDCRFGESNACEDCMGANPDVYNPYHQQCNEDPLCWAVKQCEYESNCFWPEPALCYCGVDQEGNANLANCDLPDFVPTGPCVDEILAGMGSDNPSNETVLLRFFELDMTYPAGFANAMLNAGTSLEPCPSVCIAELSPP
jgi:cysteine-rich repeat protein